MASATDLVTRLVVEQAAVAGGMRAQEGIEPQEPRITPEVGLAFACAGGAFYAVATALAAFAAKALREKREGWNDGWRMFFEAMSASVLLTGGFCVTLAYTSGQPLALMNAIAYSVQLIGNMALSLRLQLSEYTKSMYVGTIMFATATIQLSALAPEPGSSDVRMLLTIPALLFQVVFWCIVGFAAFHLQFTKDRGLRDVPKVFDYAILVTGFGVLTDNWARVLGVMEGPALIVSTGLMMVPAFALGFVYIKALSSCDVAVYIPTQLVLQMLSNVVGGYFLWGDGVGMEYPRSYILGYVLCVLAVYIASPEVDILAMITLAREMKDAGLSKGVAKTTFGEKLLGLVEAFNELKNPYQSAAGGVMVENAKEALRATLHTGCQKGHIKSEDMVNLAVDLWMHAANSTAGARAIMEWFDATPYFQEYTDKDPKFRTALIASLPPELRMSAGRRFNIPEMGVMKLSSTSSVEVARFLSTPNVTANMKGGTSLKDRMSAAGGLRDPEMSERGSGFVEFKGNSTRSPETAAWPVLGVDSMHAGQKEQTPKTRHSVGGSIGEPP